jgi:hypothetical protein
MFAEPIYLKAYQRGVFAAARTFCQLYSDGERPPADWPYPKSETTVFVSDLAPDNQRLLRRLVALAHAGAKAEWRHLTEALLRQSGIFLRPGATPPGVRKADSA